MHKGGFGTTVPGFSVAFLWLAQRRRGRWLSVADQRRQSDTQGPERGTGAARSRVAQQVDLAVLLDFGFAQPFAILHDVGPFEVVAGRDQPVLEGAVLRQLLGAAEGDDGLVRSAVDAVVLDELEILGPAREFAAKEHEGACVSATTFIEPLYCLHNL